MKIGILGFGIVGKSILNFFKNKANSITIWDDRVLSKDELQYVFESNATVSQDITSFLEHSDSIVISPGIDFRRFEINKLVCELDIFAKYFSKPTVAITGTVGKTTVTRLLGKLLYGSSVGGNIGDAMLDLLDKDVSQAVLELSSFQLELSKFFAPDLAILTNFYSNHLDRHDDMQSYWDAKLKLFQYQTSSQHALLPVALASKLPVLQSTISFLGGELDNNEIKLLLSKAKNIFYIKNNNFVHKSQMQESILYSIFDIPKISFMENWLFVIATLTLLGFSKDEIRLRIDKLAQEFTTGPHRFELFATINGVDFYNDSKATITEATIAALSQLNKNNRQVILILGGLNKGVDRSKYLPQILANKNLKEIVCFGKDCRDFKGSCTEYEDLDILVKAIMKIVKSGDQILFSPGGSSYDFFENFAKRGEYFKELIRKYDNKKQNLENQSQVASINI